MSARNVNKRTRRCDQKIEVLENERVKQAETTAALKKQNEKIIVENAETMKK